MANHPADNKKVPDCIVIHYTTFSICLEQRGQVSRKFENIKFVVIVMCEYYGRNY